MPIYEYICDNCGNRFERMQRFSDDPVKICPNCSQESVRRLISAAGVIFKGSGWYITDSRQLKSGSTAPAKELTAPKEEPKSSSPAPGDGASDD
jgi:putative FmdB family regulatory protein